MVVEELEINFSLTNVLYRVLGHSDALFLLLVSTSNEAEGKSYSA